MLVTLPIGMWIFSFVCDLISFRSGHPETWATASLYAMVGGIIGALLAALPGLVDLLSLRDRAIKKTALTHMGLNLTVVVLFAINAWMRGHGADPGGTPFILSVIAILMLGVSGWLGGKMVYEAGVAVHAGADEAETAPTMRAEWQDRRSDARAPGGMGGLGGRERAMANDKNVRETDRS
jgi:uncharacterized membrane protein